MKKYYAFLALFLLAQFSLAQATFEYDAAGNRVKRTVIPPPPDLIPTIQPLPGLIHAGVDVLTLVVRVYENAPISTTGVVTARVSKDTALIKFNFNPTAVFLSGQIVQNSSWSFDNSDPDVYIFTTTVSIATGSSLRFGITGVAKKGMLHSFPSFSVVCPTIPGEINLSNNAAATTVEYFP